MCTCDMFREPHPAGQVVGPVRCETLLRDGPRISPHLFPWSVESPG